MKAISSERLNLGAGTYNFTRQLGGAFGVNGLVVVVEQRTEVYAEALTETQTSANSLTRELMDKVEQLLSESGVPEAMQQTGALDYLGQVINAQASTFAFQDAFMVIALVFVAALIPAWVLRQTKAAVVA